MLLKLFLLLVVLAPVPAAARPDPLGLGYLGVLAADPDAAGSDLVLREVKPFEPAARAGLRVGDVLVKVGPLVPRRFDEVREYVIGVRPGTRLPVEVRRDGATLVLVVEVGARPRDVPAPDPFDPNLPPRIRVLPAPPLPQLVPPPPPNR